MHKAALALIAALAVTPAAAEETDWLVFAGQALIAKEACHVDLGLSDEAIRTAVQMGAQQRGIAYEDARIFMIRATTEALRQLRDDPGHHAKWCNALSAAAE